MKKSILPFLALMYSASCYAETGSFKFTDNSDNEDGFIVEALAGGEWVETQRLAPNVNEFDLLDFELYDACRVWAYVESWGVELRSDGFAMASRKEKPVTPSGLGFVRRGIVHAEINFREDLSNQFYETKKKIKTHQSIFQTHRSQGRQGGS